MMKTCFGCGRSFYKGKKALVQGVMRTVCLSCSEGAIRVVCTVTSSKCCDPHCSELATTCNAHVLRVAKRNAELGNKPARDALMAAIRAMHLVVPKDADRDGFEHAQGKLEGLESALEILLRLEGTS
jgi:hypothetical protein